MRSAMGLPHGPELAAFSALSQSRLSKCALCLVWVSHVADSTRSSRVCSCTQVSVLLTALHDPLCLMPPCMHVPVRHPCTNWPGPAGGSSSQSSVTFKRIAQFPSPVCPCISDRATFQEKHKMLKQQEEQQRNSLEQALKLHRRTSLPVPAHASGMAHILPSRSAMCLGPSKCALCLVNILCQSTL